MHLPNIRWSPHATNPHIMLQNLSQKQDQLQLTSFASMACHELCHPIFQWSSRSMRMENVAQQSPQKHAKHYNFFISWFWWMCQERFRWDLGKHGTSSRDNACYEPQDARGSAGIGAVIVDQLGRYRGFLSTFLTEDLLAKLNITKRKTIIFECELLAIFLWQWHVGLNSCETRRWWCVQTTKAWKILW